MMRLTNALALLATTFMGSTLAENSSKFLFFARCDILKPLCASPFFLQMPLFSALPNLPGCFKTLIQLLPTCGGTVTMR